MVEDRKVDLNDPEDMQAMKKELEEIRLDMMRRELEEIKRERMRKELDEIKAERAGNASASEPRAAIYSTEPELSVFTLIFSAIALLLAGYMFGTLFGFNITASINDSIGGFGLPIDGSIILVAAALLFTLIGIGTMTMVRK